MDIDDALRTPGPVRFACGYGLLWSDFLRVGFPGDGVVDHEAELERRFSSLRPDSAVVPGHEIEDMRRSFGGSRSVNANILRWRNISGQGSLADILSGTELYRTIRGPKDRPAAVVFIPDMTYRGDWIVDSPKPSDAASAQKGVVRISEAAGFAPFSSDWMDGDGRAVAPADAPHMPPGRVFPAVPLSIRWYATRMGVLDHEGVNRMRPTSAWYRAGSQ